MYNIMVREYPKPEEADRRHRFIFIQAALLALIIASRSRIRGEMHSYVLR